MHFAKSCLDLLLISNNFRMIKAMHRQLYILSLPMCAIVLSSCSSNKIEEGSKANQSSIQKSQVRDCAGDQRDSATKRTVSVVPQLPQSKIYAYYWPLLENIGQQTDICFKLKLAADIPEFEKLLESSEVDYAFMNPYHLVINKERYTPLIRDSNKLLTGIIVTSKVSSIQNLQDIDGQELYLPAPNAFGASLLVRSYLSSQGIKPIVKYVKTHSNVYRNSIMNPDGAGGGVNNTLKRENPGVRQQIRIIKETKGYPAHPFSSKSILPSNEQIKVQNAWLILGENKANFQLLNKAQIPTPMKADYKKDYQQLESLGLERYVQ